VVKSLCYKPKGREFETHCSELILSIYLILPAELGPAVYSETSTRRIQVTFLGSKARPVRRTDNRASICEPII
jgi:hypothetical protein